MFIYMMFCQKYAEQLFCRNIIIAKLLNMFIASPLLKHIYIYKIYHNFGKKIKLKNIVGGYAFFSLQKRYLSKTVSIMKNFYNQKILKTSRQIRDKSKLTLFTPKICSGPKKFVLDAIKKSITNFAQYSIYKKSKKWKIIQYITYNREIENNT